MDKYLPVGTICTLSNDNRKYIIVGYFSLQYNRRVKMYDYVGLPYPEGLLKGNNQISFNHFDIAKIDYLGYINEDFRKFNNILNDSTYESENEIANNDGVFNNFSFDENGVVTYEYIEKIPPIKNQEYYDYSIVQEQQSYENPFNFKNDYERNDNLIEDNPDDWSIFKKIEFDENGVVVQAE